MSLANKLKLFLGIFTTFAVIIEVAVCATLSFNVDVAQAEEYYSEGKYAECVTMCLDLVERTEDNDEFYILCADAYLAAGDYQSALELLKEETKYTYDENDILLRKYNEIEAMEFSEPSKTVEVVAIHDAPSDKYTFIMLFTIGLTSLIFVVLFILISKLLPKQTRSVDAEPSISQPVIAQPHEDRSTEQHAPVFETNVAASENQSGLTCRKCGSHNISVQVVNEASRRGCFVVFLYIILTITVIGIFILIPLLRGPKSKTKTYAVCQNCGNKWIIN